MTTTGTRTLRSAPRAGRAADLLRSASLLLWSIRLSNTDAERDQCGAAAAAAAAGWHRGTARRPAPLPRRLEGGRAAILCTSLHPHFSACRHDLPINTRTSVQQSEQCLPCRPKAAFGGEPLAAVAAAEGFAPQLDPTLVARAAEHFDKAIALQVPPMPACSRPVFSCCGRLGHPLTVARPTCSRSTSHSTKWPPTSTSRA